MSFSQGPRVLLSCRVTEGDTEMVVHLLHRAREVAAFLLPQESLSKAEGVGDECPTLAGSLLALLSVPLGPPECSEPPPYNLSEFSQGHFLLLLCCLVLYILYIYSIYIYKTKSTDKNSVKVRDR